MKTVLSISLCVVTALTVQAQSITEKFARFLTMPHGYVCYRTADPIKIDGRMTELSWQKAEEITAFVDISGEGFPQPRHATKAKMLWDDEYLYVGAELEEPHVWADIKTHDEVVYYNNDFEVFIDPDGDAHNYFEIEINALGTLFDLAIEKPYRAITPTFVQFQWDCPGLKAKTQVKGTINNPKDVDEGWSVELAIPRKAIAQSFDNYLQADNYLRVGFSRVEWQHELVDGKYARKKNAEGKYLPEDNWTWGPTGMIAMHMPERWGFVYLSGSKVGEQRVEFRYPEEFEAERLLWAMFYAQEEQYARTGRFFSFVDEFRLTDKERAMLPKGAQLRVESMSHAYEITLIKADGTQIYIDHDGYLRRRGK